MTRDGLSTFITDAMKTRLSLPVLLAAAFANAQPAAPEAAPPKLENPPAAPAEAQTEMQKWIATTDAQWQAAFKRDVSDAREAELNKVKLQYLMALEEGIKKASAAGDLKGALALRDEQKRFGDTQVFPEKDEEADAPAVKAVRTATRVQLAKVEKDQAARAKPLHAKYDQFLAQAQTQLTRSGRLDDALLLQKKREEVKGAWLAGLPAIPPPAALEPSNSAQPGLHPAVTAAPTPESRERNLLKNANFENGTDGWDLIAFGNKGTMTLDRKELHNGKPSVRIDSTEGGLSFVRQMVEGKPNTHYQLSGYIMTKDVEPVKKGTKEGACLMVGFIAEVFVGTSESKARGGKSASIQKTKPWTKIVVDFTSGSKTGLPVGGALGYYNENVKGTAWFAEMSLIEMGSHAGK